MKRIICNKYFVIILAFIVIICFAGYKIIKAEHMKKDYQKYNNNIAETVIAGEKYSNEMNDENRNDFINKLKKLSLTYAEIRDSEKGNRAYDAKLLCVFLACSYDVLENYKNRADRLSELLEGLRALETDTADESGNGLDHILNFVNANTHSPDEETSLEETVKEALKQIEEKKYEQTLLNKGIEKERIRKYGFAFEGKKVLIG